MAQAFGVPAFPVDTHIHRLAQRWGLSNGDSVERTEKDLKSLFQLSTGTSFTYKSFFMGENTARRVDAMALFARCAASSIRSDESP
jgi:endonuclease-3